MCLPDWAISYLKSKGDEDQEINWSRYSGKVTFKNIRKALERGAEAGASREREKPYINNPDPIVKNFPYFYQFLPRDGCPNCKYLALYHLYGNNTCTYGVLSTIFNPSIYSCEHYTQVANVEETEIYFLTRGVWRMLWEFHMPNSIPFKYFHEIYWAWRKSPECRGYVEQYHLLKKKGATNG
jgi:hypothetical protein